MADFDPYEWIQTSLIEVRLIPTSGFVNLSDMNEWFESETLPDISSVEVVQGNDAIQQRLLYLIAKELFNNLGSNSGDAYINGTIRNVTDSFIAELSNATHTALVTLDNIIQSPLTQNAEGNAWDIPVVGLVKTSMLTEAQAQAVHDYIQDNIKLLEQASVQVDRDPTYPDKINITIQASFGAFGKCNLTVH